MKSNLRRLGLVLSLLVVPLVFTNCSGYSPSNDSGAASASSDACAEGECISADAKLLEVKSHEGLEFPVNATLFEFNIGGSCNEGGFPYNQIRWELHLNGAKVRDSGMSGIGKINGPVHTRCVNGRFLIYVDLRPISADNVNRTGLYNGGVRTAYDLYIEIFGMKSANDPAPVKNPLKGRTRISLLAI